MEFIRSQSDHSNDTHIICYASDEVPVSMLLYQDISNDPINNSKQNSVVVL